MPVASPSPLTEAVVRRALLTPRGDDRTREEYNQAQVLLSLPAATLAAAVTALWLQESVAHQRRCRRHRGMSGLLLALCGFLLALNRWGELAFEYHVLLSFVPLVCFVGAIIVGCRATLSPLLSALLRFIHQRRDACFAPLLIDALAITPGAFGVVNKAKTRVALKRSLPLWCAQDSSPLTPARQRLLLREIKAVTTGTGAVLRFAGAPRRAMTLTEADFALAALAALRHSQQGATQDSVTQQVLSQLPAPESETDPRREIRNAAQALLVRPGK